MNALAHRRATPVLAAVAALLLALGWVVTSAPSAGADATGSISGTITLGAGVPLEDMEGVRVTAVGTTGATPPSVIPAEDGTYTVAGLAPGDYRIFFDAGLYLGSGGVTSPSYRREYFNDVFTSEEAAVITVAEGEAVTGKDATLDLLGHFTMTPDPVIKYTKLTETSVLGLSTGTWSPAPTFAFQWKRNGANIAGATQSTYEITDTDVGKNITVAVTGTKTQFTPVTRTSAPVFIGYPFEDTVAPTISGTAKAGKTLTAHRGTWSPTTTSHKYQWKRNGVAIPGATAYQYVLTTADRGTNITVTVTGLRPTYLTTARTSAKLYIPKVFTTAITPKISGTGKAGYTLTAIRGTWVPTPTYSYQWYRNGVKITGATGKSYTVKSLDKGKKLTVKVTGKRSGYLTTSRTSAPKSIAS